MLAWRQLKREAGTFTFQQGPGWHDRTKTMTVMNAEYDISCRSPPANADEKTGVTDRSLLSGRISKALRTFSRLSRIQPQSCWIHRAEEYDELMIT